MKKRYKPPRHTTKPKYPPGFAHLLSLYRRCGNSFENVLSQIVEDHDHGCGCPYCSLQSAPPEECDAEHCGKALAEFYLRQEETDV